MSKYYVTRVNESGFSGAWVVKQRRSFWFDKLVAEFSVYVYGDERAKQKADWTCNELR